MITSHGLLWSLPCKWALRPGAPVPATLIMCRGPRGVPTEVSTSPRQEHESCSLQPLGWGHPQLRLGCTSRNSSCGGAKYLGEATPTTLVSSRPTQITGGRASLLGSPLSRSWPLCWSPQNTRKFPRCPTARSPVTQLGQPQGRSLVASRAKPMPAAS